MMPPEKPDTTTFIDAMDEVVFGKPSDVGDADVSWGIRFWIAKKETVGFNYVEPTLD